jgi:hypothetical protein
MKLSHRQLAKVGVRGRTATPPTLAELVQSDASHCLQVCAQAWAGAAALRCMQEFASTNAGWRPVQQAAHVMV